jgi:hypothetical protein
MAAISVRCLEGVDYSALPAAHFDGRALWEAGRTSMLVAGLSMMTKARGDAGKEGPLFWTAGLRPLLLLKVAQGNDLCRSGCCR